MATSLIPVTYTTHVNPPMPSGQRRAGPEAQTRSNVGANAKVGRVENIVRNRFPQDLPVRQYRVSMHFFLTSFDRQCLSNCNGIKFQHLARAEVRSHNPQTLSLVRSLEKDHDLF